MKTNKIFDIDVIGRGMMGTSAAKYLANMGASIIIIGPGEPKNRSTHKGVFGSHYDSGRITRILDKDPYYAKISELSIKRFREIENISGINFYENVGLITISGIHSFLDELKDCAKRHNLNHSVVDHKDLALTFPYLNFQEGMTGIYEQETAGYIDPRKFISAQGEIINFFGGKIIKETVTKIKENNGYYSIYTDKNNHIKCEKILLATGPFANHLGLIPKFVSIKIIEHTVVFGEISYATLKTLKKMPSIIYRRTEDIFGSVYILPPIKYPDGRFWLKIGQSRGKIMMNPEKNLIPWFQSHGDKEISEWLLSELKNILPKIKFISTHYDSCVTTKSNSGYQFIDKFDSKEIYSCLVGDGQAAKSADEIGRIAAHKILYGEVPGEYKGINFKNDYY